MRKVLYILGQFTDGDIEWLAEAGRKRKLAAEEELIRVGQQPASLFIVLDGHLRVVDPQIGVLAELASGEIVGEMSFVDRAPPQASVIAGDAAIVLEISRRALQAKIDNDTAFGLRFFRALSVFLADRLRGTVRRLGYSGGGSLAGDDVLEDELDEGILDDVSQAGDRFSRLLRTLGSARGV